VARAKVTQLSLNPHRDWYEGVYVFPLPENAAVDRLRMRIGERIVEGEVQEKAQARQTYAEAKSEGRRAALLEQERPNIFTSSVANIAPGEEVRVEIEYQQTLRYDQGRYSLRFPDGGRSPATCGEHGSGGRGAHSPAVLRPDESAQIHNPVACAWRSRPACRWRIAQPLALPSTDRILRRRAVPRAAARSGSGNKDFVLDWGLAPARPGRGRDHRAEERPALRPRHGRAAGARAARRAIPREAIFVIDTSGSMQGTSIAQSAGSAASCDPPPFRRRPLQT
jgi:Ca-activated chloride channel family protein